MTRAKKSPERVLFFSLWGLLLLGTAMWKFWPKPSVIEDPYPSVILDGSLVTWFQRARVMAQTPTRYTVEVIIQTRYLQEMRNDQREVHLAFHLLGEHNVLSQGVVDCILSPAGRLVVEIPNPNRVSAGTIQLAIAN